MTWKGAGRLAGIWALLWLCWIIALTAGLAMAWTTGQIDPELWSLPAGAVLLVTAIWRGGRDASWAAAGLLLMILIFCWIAAARPPALAPIFWLAASMVLSVAGGAWLRRGRRSHRGLLLAGAGALGLAALLIWHGGPAPIEEQAGERPVLAIVTALPLFWEGDRPREAPIVRLLKTRFIVEAVDDPASLDRTGARALLLAQPRAMPPDRLVAIDEWVRNGGRALILADPMLRWSSDIAMGDRRAPPAVSLLDPLLVHWGIGLTDAKMGEVRRFIDGGRLLTLLGFGDATASCGRSRDGIAQCRIGQGGVTVVGDADLIDDRLWLSDPARPLDPRAWSADTPALVAQWLGASIPGERRWMASMSALVAAMRWALLVGLIWAAMGVVLHQPFKRRPSMR